ncbi:38990_t:CDS:2, partial [Gigaspora margarita]
VQTQDGNQIFSGKELRSKALLRNFYSSSNVDTLKKNGSFQLKMILKKSNQITQTFYEPDARRGSKKYMELGIRKALKEKVLDGAEKKSMSSSTEQIQSPPKNRDRHYEEKN